MTVRCGNPVHKSYLEELASEVHHHETVAKVRLCYARKDKGGVRSIEEAARLAEVFGRLDAEVADDDSDGFDPDVAYERHLETRDWEEHQAHDEWEARMGMKSYEQAREEWEEREAYRAELGRDEAL